MKKAFSLFIVGLVAVMVVVIWNIESPNSMSPAPLPIDLQSMAQIRLKSGIDMSKTDPKTCANAFTSVVKLSSQKRQFRLGETIHVVIQLFDSYKRRKTRGGDFVRVLMRENSLNASAAGSVTDNGDGTYTGSLKALWTGTPRIEAVVVGSRETMEIFNRSYQEHDTSRFFLGVFQVGVVKEVTRCVAGPQVPGYRNVCNLTAENYGLPWYCGKPSNVKLSCGDVKGMMATNGRPIHFSPHERRFFDLKYLFRALLHQTIPVHLQIEIISNGINDEFGKNKTTIPLPTIPCNKSPLRKSWEASAPVGFFYKNQWRSLTCNNTVPPDPQVYRKCLKDRTLWIHGDSTARYWLQNMQKRLRMKLSKGLAKVFYNTKWKSRTEIRSDEWNTSIIFVPHGYPFYHGLELRTFSFFRGSHTYLDDLPSHSRDIFVIHMYLHFLAMSPEVFRSHVRKIVQSVKSLLSRAPDIKLAVRGAHAFKGPVGLGFMDDIFMLTYDKIWKEEFREVQDKVLFLNSEDITIVQEIDDPHPSPIVLNSLINHLMGYVCD